MIRKQMAGPPQMDAHKVLAGLRGRSPRSPDWAKLQTSFTFIVERARQVLGPDSPEYVALILRVTAPVGLSIRAMCREHYGWHRCRSELYRRSHNGGRFGMHAVCATTLTAFRFRKRCWRANRCAFPKVFMVTFTSVLRGLHF